MKVALGTHKAMLRTAAAGRQRTGMGVEVGRHTLEAERTWGRTVGRLGGSLRAAVVSRSTWAWLRQGTTAVAAAGTS